MRRRARRARPARGFGLLEAIVALALLAGVGLILFDWLRQNLETASRLSQTEARAAMMLSAQAAIAAVNPSTHPEGTLSTGGLTVAWRAVAVQPERGNATLVPPASGPWVIGLYRMDVRAQDRAGTETRFSQLQTGTRRTRPHERF